MRAVIRRVAAIAVVGAAAVAAGCFIKPAPPGTTGDGGTRGDSGPGIDAPSTIDGLACTEHAVSDLSTGSCGTGGVIGGMAGSATASDGILTITPIKSPPYPTQCTYMPDVEHDLIVEVDQFFGGSPSLALYVGGHFIQVTLQKGQTTEYSVVVTSDTGGSGSSDPFDGTGGNVWLNLRIAGSVVSAGSGSDAAAIEIASADMTPNDPSGAHTVQLVAVGSAATFTSFLDCAP